MTLLDQGVTPQTVGPHAKIVREFETLAETHNARGPYLEVCIGPQKNAVLLDEYFSGEERHTVGLEAATESNGVTFNRGNPNDMRDLFVNGRFSTVFWNGALAHDRYFWRSLEEIKRVLAPGGVLIVAAPGYSKKAKFGLKVVGAKGSPIDNATVTPRVHLSRPDYWRVSPQAMKQTILEGFEVREVHISMLVPWVFGVGVKPT
jgi:SAM-dependent methyltransferase